MRLTQIMLVLAAPLLFVSEVSALTTDSNQISSVASLANPSQRFLRAHHDVIETDADFEERALTPEKMMKMMLNKMTKEEYAAKLGILEKINSGLNGGALMQFMRTYKYNKYRGYMDFLNGMAKTKKYAKLVKEIKAK
ncbi:hypothetical protein F442_23125 [Phytophthora nicotianae P10297]|uniref:PexRD2 WYL domain-containing protein n=1 Tax=Phytophthora nicotianae P10297 TaxID=1317064 RepID=W2Y085_PHYNI|nr:hypothetical protein F442_23124 [Phytophthora nicotianae P10297]ETP27599.1 hypothetical protein F442_23125 [Phytophthora nicotianae P10297]